MENVSLNFVAWLVDSVTKMHVKNTDVIHFSCFISNVISHWHIFHDEKLFHFVWKNYSMWKNFTKCNFLTVFILVVSSVASSHVSTFFYLMKNHSMRNVFTKNGFVILFVLVVSSVISFCDSTFFIW